jgi:transposase
MIVDQGYVCHAFREVLNGLGIKASIAGRKHRNIPVERGTQLHEPRNQVESAFDRLKNWRRIAISHDRCTHTHIHERMCIVETVIFWS